MIKHRRCQANALALTAMHTSENRKQTQGTNTASSDRPMEPVSVTLEGVGLFERVKPIEEESDTVGDVDAV